MSPDPVAHRPRVALLVEQEFDDAQVNGLTEALGTAGVDVVAVGPLAGVEYRGTGGAVVTAGVAAGRARMKDFDALVIPGGHAPDRMRLRHAMIDLVRAAVTAGKPVAAIGHGPQLLISVNALRGRTITCWPSIAVDVKNAGGLYYDRSVLEDEAFITARKADDVPGLAAALLRRLTAA
jgi:protease I